MTKQEQIELINKLISDPDNYFVDQFGLDGLKQMQQNITNDHTLLCNVKVNDFVALSSKNIRVIKKCLKEKIEKNFEIIEKAENDPHADSAKIILLKEECIDLIFAENKL